MNTIADKLQLLNNTKIAIKKAIEEKGVTNVGNVFADYPAKIKEITGGGGGGSSEGGDPFDFKSIGYTGVEEPLASGIAYAKQIQADWGVTPRTKFSYDKRLSILPMIDTTNITNMNAMFSQCSSLICLPKFDTSNVTNMSNMFGGCYSLTSVPQFDTSQVTSMYCMFKHCYSLATIPQFNTSNVTEMHEMFVYCSSLKEIPILDTRNVTKVNHMFDFCDSLERIEGLDFSSVTGLDFYFIPMNCKYCLIKNIGMQQQINDSNNLFLGGDMWGEYSDTYGDTKQSVIDTLITYSFDRASARYDVINICLSSATKALLSEDEKAQITAKGYTIA